MKGFKSLIFLLLALASVFTVAAQGRMVSGTVVDSQDEPLPGVTVTVTGGGKSQSGMTDLDGKFSIKAPEGASNVEVKFSYVGFATQTVKATPGQSNLSIVMKEDAVQLEETVVIGYGTQKKVNLTGAVASVSSKELENRASHSLTNMLQGAVAGLNITTSSGVPGQSPSVNVRGTTSINSSSPLVLVDGAEGYLEQVNPNDVESVSIIKDASAAAVYGARAAFGVILVTTKSGNALEGKATVRYNGRMGWEESTTSTEFETRGYWWNYTVNTFYENAMGTKFMKYNDYDMQQMLARVNDKTENPDRPWVTEQVRDGKNQWIYYGNYDWYHMMYRDRRPVQQHNVSLSGGLKGIKYFVSGGYDRQEGYVKGDGSDVYNKYNLRSKIDFPINKWADFSNNTTFFGSTYKFSGSGNIEDAYSYGARLGVASIPMKNPDGTWIYEMPMNNTNQRLANGRHIMYGEGSHRNVDRKVNFTNTSRLTLKPVDHLTITGDFTYRFYQSRNTHRKNPFPYRAYPGEDMKYYDTGAGQNQLDEIVNTTQYYSANIYGTYTNTFNKVHNLTVTAGYNYETKRVKNFSAYGQNILSDNLDDFKLVGTNSEGNVITGVSGNQGEYALSGIFARANYDYAGKYLLEVSGRYDGTSRFARGHRWGFFPSASVGWRISEENFFEDLRQTVNNLKLRLSYGSLGNQNVSEYYAYLRLISTSAFAAYSFGEGSAMAKYSTLGKPKASDLTWETAKQWNVGLDYAMLNSRLNLTADVYVRNTVNMLTTGVALPGVYGATEPDMNAADLRTKGYEVAVSWRDNVNVAGRKLNYSLSFNISDYRSHITKFDNPEKSFAKNYYVGMRLGEIWGYSIDGLFRSTEEAQEYTSRIDCSNVTGSYLKNGFEGGDPRFLDLNGDGKISTGNNTADDPGDRKVIGNSLPSLSYGITATVSYLGFDVSAFFQGTGNHHWYPAGQSMPFWGPHSYPYTSFMKKDVWENTWAPDNLDAYFPRPIAYTSSSGTLKYVNDRYLQNIRYLRFKNLTVGYTIPKNLTRKAYIETIRVYFTGENLCYWSPIKKHSKYIDPEASISRSNDVYQNAFYPWSKTFMFGLDVTF